MKLFLGGSSLRSAFAKADPQGAPRGDGFTQVAMGARAQRRAQGEAAAAVVLLAAAVSSSPGTEAAAERAAVAVEAELCRC